MDTENPTTEFVNVEAEKPEETVPSQEQSSLEVSPDVIRSIAYREAAIIDGIVSLEDTFTHNIWSMFRGGDQPKGVRVELSGNEVTIALRVSVLYGVRIPQVILELRQRITETVRHMTGYEVKAIHVSVNRIFLKEVKAGEALEGITSATGVSDKDVEFR